MTSPVEPSGPDRPRPRPRRALVVGTGLIGGSVGLALAAQGWEVRGYDTDPARSDAALVRRA
ncbi:MAG: hypothetical protein ACRDXC_13780, partial [Acidimicrobiales bacterium]